MPGPVLPPYPSDPRIHLAHHMPTFQTCPRGAAAQDSHPSTHSPHSARLRLHRLAVPAKGANVSIEFASGVGANASALDLAMTPLNCASAAELEAGLAATGGTVNCSDFAASFHSDFAWSRAGSIVTTQDTIEYRGAGLRTVSLHPTSPASSSWWASTGDPSRLSFVLGAGGGLTTASATPSFDSIQSRLAFAQAKVLGLHAKYGKLAEVARAVQAAVMWCLLYVPSELGPFAPVRCALRFAAPGSFSARSGACGGEFGSACTADTLRASGDLGTRLLPVVPGRFSLLPGLRRGPSGFM